MSKLNSFLNDKQLIDILSDCSGNEDISQEFSQLSNQLDSKQFYLSITGVQGAGKSTLINALLFDEPVLPTDVNETTCIPVEVSYAQGSPQATIKYKSGKSDTIDANEERLKKYVHNDFNPANRLNVEKITVTSQREFLNNNVVVVDLPGVGSLTEENHQTTLRYLDESTAVLFLLRTVPPITRSDSVFIGTVWPKIPTALFVQNQWSDEGRDEVEEGREDNAEKLIRIAEKRNIALSNNQPEISIVNVDQAWHGVLSANQEKVSKSGLDKLQKKLFKLSETWPLKVRQEVGHRIMAHLVYAQQKIVISLKDCDKSSEAIKQELKVLKAEFRDYEDSIEQSLQKGHQHIQQAQTKLKKIIGDWKREEGGNLRNIVKAKIQGGIYDGRALDQMLNDEKSSVSMDLNEKIQDLIYEVEAELADIELPSWEEIQIKNKGAGHKERAKYENYLPGFGGAAASVAVGVAKYYGVAFLASNPVGWAAAAGIAAWGLLSLVKKKVKSSRAEEAIKVVIPHINQFLDEHSNLTESHFQQHFDSIMMRLAEWKASNIGTFETSYKVRRQKSQLSAEQREQEKSSIQKKADYVTEKMKSLTHELGGQSW